MAAENDKRKIVLKIKPEDEKIFRQVFMEVYPKTAPEDLDKYVKYALAEGKPEDEGGLQWPDLDEEGQKREYDLVNSWNIGKVTANPPIPGEEPQPKSEAEKGADDDVIVTPPPEPKDQPTDEPSKTDPSSTTETEKPAESTTEEPLKEQPIEDQPKDESKSEVHDQGSPQVDDEPKPEMAEIVLIRYEKEKIFDALKALYGYGISIDDGGNLLKKLDAGEKQTVSVLKSQKGEALEKLAAAGFTIEVPEPVESETETPISNLTDKDLEAIVTVVVQDTFVDLANSFDEVVDKIKEQIAEIKMPEVNLASVVEKVDLVSGKIDSFTGTGQDRVGLELILQKINGIKLDPLSDQISETDKTVEEMKEYILGATDNEGNILKSSIKSDLVDAFGDMADEIGWLKKLLIGCGVGILLLAVACAWLLFKPAPAMKIDEAALNTAVQAAVGSAYFDTTTSADKSIAKEVIKQMKADKLLLAPTATTTTQIQTKPGGGTTAPRTGGKH